MKIYFAGAIAGGRQDAPLYAQIIEHLARFGQVLTEHVGDARLTSGGEALDSGMIRRRDLAWVDECDVLVVEATVPSTGVGIEIERAASAGKRIICLYRPGENRRLSAMVEGCAGLSVIYYSNPADLEPKLDAAFARGKYIVIEGPHMCGKTVQQLRLIEALRARGIDALRVGEPTYPGPNSFGWARTYVQQQADRDTRVEAMLMYADRRDQLERVVEPALSRGQWIIQSRNFLSAFILQGDLGGLGWPVVEEIHNFAMQGLVTPDLILVLDPGEPEVLRQRATEALLEEDVLERNIDLEDRRRLLEAYRRLEYTYPEWPIRRIRGDLPIDDVHGLTLGAVDEL